MVLFALACGQTNILAISQWIRNHEALLLGHYQLFTRHNEPKLLSQATLYRFFWGIEKHIGVLKNRLRQWTPLLLKERAGVGISFDGKVLRGSRRSRGNEAALTLLSAYVQELGLTLHQEALKGRESSQAKRVIDHLRALGAFVVTGDAAYADASLAHSVRKAGGHYLLALKHNQPELLDLAQWVFTLPQCQTATHFALSQVRSGEVWEWHALARAITAEMTHGFPGVQQFVRCTRRVFAKAANRSARSPMP